MMVDLAVKHSDEVFQIMTCEKVSVGPPPERPISVPEKKGAVTTLIVSLPGRIIRRVDASLKGA